MRERPILFSAPMVRAILDGRKTQTRRIMKPQPEKVGGFWQMPPPFGAMWSDNCKRVPVVSGHSLATRNRYGQPGERLWVKETFTEGEGVIYREDWDRHDAITGALDGLWKPSIFMPRRFSRITLEIEAVRVERLQGISEADAFVEGCEPLPEKPNDIFQYTKGYQKLWNSINGPDSWDANPWVWVVQFKRIKP